MNTLLNLYFKLPHDNSFGIVSKALNRLVAKILKRILDRNVPRYFEKTQIQFPEGLNKQARKEKLIISLTSFPGRIKDVWIVVECLFRQTYQPDRIVLWLSKSQFQGINLPELLIAQQKRGLEIIFVDDDLRSHKKYFYALQQFSSDIIVTVDDDVFYHENVLMSLVNAHEIHPKEVIANRAHKIRFDVKGEILPYREWEINYKSSTPSFTYVPTGVGGVLYPPGSLSLELLNIEAIKRLCFHADDLWLKVGSLLSTTRIVITPYFRQEFITIGKTQNSKLVTSNSLGGGNDVQLRKILSFFNLVNYLN
jgi:hypothetical protein